MGIKRYSQGWDEKPYENEHNGEYALWEDHKAEVATLTASFEMRIAELESQLKAAELDAGRFNWFKRYLPADGWTVEAIDREIAIDAALAKVVLEQDE